MPTLFEWKGWKFLFYSLDRGEPPHLHVRKDRKELKIWLQPIALAFNRRCAGHEVNEIMSVVTERHREILNAWNAHFG